MKKLLIFFFLVIFICSINFLIAQVVSSDNVLHLKCNANIFNSKTALIYPNPFSESTTIFYTPDTTEDLSIRLYSSKGIFIDELFHEKVEQGKLYEFVLCGDEMESGIYHCVIETKDKIIHQRLEIVR